MDNQFLSLFETQPVDTEPQYPIDLSGKFSSPTDPILYPFDSNKPHGQNEAFVRSLYQTYYHREADAPGLNYWVAQLDNGAARASVTNAFATTPDISPNAGQTLYDYLISQGITPSAGVDPIHNPIDPTMPINVYNPLKGASPIALQSITALPIVGPIVSSVVQATGWSPTTIVIAAVVALVVGLGAMGGSNKSS